MANPQPEPFVKFSKELFDALLLSSMPAGHKEIVLAIIRRTYGEHGQKVAPVSYSLLRRMTGRADSGIRRSVSALEHQGVIRKVAEPTFRTPALWQLNKDYEKWGAWSVRSATVVADPSNEIERPGGRDSSERQTATTVAERSATRVAEESATRVAPLKNIEHRRGGAPPAGDPLVDDLSDFRDIEADEDPWVGPPPKNRPPAQELVAFYVEEHKRTLGSGPTKRQIGILADIVGEKLKGGASPDAVKVAIRSMVRKGKGPSTLPAFVDEAEVAARGQPGPGPDLGPPPTEEERVASAQAARATNALVQALARKKAMPT
jgi:hypothetical protein